MIRSARARTRTLTALAILLAGCADEGTTAESAASDEPPPGTPRTAVWGTVLEMRRDRDAVRHPSDGVGRAFLEDPAQAKTRVGARGHFTIVFEAGAPGVAVGGSVSLLPEPYWWWSPAQIRIPTADGFTRVTTDAEGVELEVQDAGGKLYAIVGGRALEEGERIVFDYGAGPAGVKVDRYAESGSRLWIGVDGDGDGVQKVLADSPTVDVAPGPPARAALVLPSVVVPGEEAMLSVAVVDAGGNALEEFSGKLVFDPFDDALSVDLTAEHAFAASEQGRTRLPIRFDDEAFVRVRGRVFPEGDEQGFEVESNPCLVSSNQPPILWADLHGHSQLSDGTGTPEAYFAYARDVSALDAVALTDHDHWGVRFFDRNPELWERVKQAARDAHEPGRFVSILGYEWTSWIHGHRHVLYFGDDGPLLSSLDDAYDDPRELWDALRGTPAMTFAHHSAGGPIATNWSIPPDPELEPVTEITSVHGSSEARDSPAVIYRGLPGDFVRDQLDQGLVLGFIGSGDSHDGHPGLAHWNAPSGGLAAILARDHTREAILEALRARRCYATNGERIVLRTSLSGHRMGASIEVASLPDEPALVVLALGTGPIDKIDLIRSGLVTRHEIEPTGRFMGEIAIENPQPGEYAYVRVIQSDGNAAWSSPFFFQ